jgi:hypothetical protein
LPHSLQDDAAAGDTVEVELHLDLEPRPVELHPDLAAALAAAPAAEAAFGRSAISAVRIRSYAG